MASSSAINRRERPSSESAGKCEKHKAARLSKYGNGNLESMHRQEQAQCFRRETSTLWGCESDAHHQHQKGSFPGMDHRELAASVSSRRHLSYGAARGSIVSIRRETVENGAARASIVSIKTADFEAVGAGRPFGRIPTRASIMLQEGDY